MITKLHHQQSGQILVMSLIILTLLIVNSVLIIGGSLTYNQSSKYSLQDVQAINVAEAGLDKAIASINKTAGNYNGESETSLGEGSYSVTVSTIDASTKQIVATGYIPDKATAKVKRSVTMQLVKDSGVSFTYGLQAGQGGLDMSGGALVTGSVYSNNNIVMSGGATINGDAYVAGGTQPNPDQSADCTGVNCADYTFGKNVSGQNILDVAQSFRPTSTAVINKVALKIKKQGTPSDLTVRILTDTSGRPNKNGVLASGTLYSNLVTTNYGWIDVNLLTNPTLTANTIYWIVLDTQSNATNYWYWQSDTAQSYNNGQAKWSTDWQAGNPTWTLINGDLSFQTYMGGVNTSIVSSGGPIINGNAHANTINATSGTLTIRDGAYYQTINGYVYVGGSACTNNSKCHPATTDPPSVNFPISDANIQSWKDSAAANGTYNGNINGCQANIPSGKYVGNITLNGGCTATMTDPVWITGNFSISGGAVLKLNSSYGINSGVIVTDGTMSFSGGGQVRGSGTAGSYMLGISTFDSRSNGNTAISLSGGSNTTILYAKEGLIDMTGGTNLRELSGWKLRLSGGASVTYDAGLANLNFNAGPSGTYTPIKGSYKVK
jgi:hypothetical protein